MRAMLCGCGQRLEAEEDTRLCERVAAHLKREHRTSHVDHETVRGMVTSRAYEVEYAVMYTDGTTLDEEFGLEPY